MLEGACLGHVWASLGLVKRRVRLEGAGCADEAEVRRWTIFVVFLCLVPEVMVPCCSHDASGASVGLGVGCPHSIESLSKGRHFRSCPPSTAGEVAVVNAHVVDP